MTRGFRVYYSFADTRTPFDSATPDVFLGLRTRRLRSRFVRVTPARVSGRAAMGAPARIHAAGERVSLLPGASASAGAGAEAEAEARARASPLRRVPARAAAASALALLALAGCAAAGPEARSAALAALGGPPAPRRNAVHRAIPRGRDDPSRAATRATRRAVVPRLGGAPDPADASDDSADASSSSSPDSDRPTLGLAERFRRAATASGFVLPVTADERAAHAWLADDDSDASSDSAADASGSSPRSSSARDPKDLLLENILGGGADAIPDVVPGIPFDVRDAAYDEPGWFHRPIARRSETRRNAFTFCVDSADEWDLAFPEGWFQNWRFGVNGVNDANDSSDSSSSSTSTPGYCVESVTYARNGASCGDADVVLFNEGALIWHGRHSRDDARDPSGPAYLLPPKAHPAQTYVYFAHEAPAGFGNELLDPSVMSQFDYLASANRAGSSLWWSFVPSARHLTQDFDAFRRPLANRAPVLAWLAIDCGGKAREGILGEIARHFPVWSVGSCRNNKPSDPDLPGRDASSDEQRRRMQMSLSKYLFYFAAENAECPGYTTEKLWLALSRGSVPVYFGDGEVKAHLPCDECVLDVRDFPDAQSLAARMRAIATTPGEYERITAWRRGDPKAWPEAFREALAVASADVARVTCGVLREGPRAYRKAEAQGKGGGGAQGGGDGGEVGGVARLAAAKRAACPANDGDDSDETVDETGSSSGSSEGSSSSGALGGGGARSGPRPVFGRRVRAFESGGADGGAFVAPETHYERPCDDDERAECFRFRASS